MSFIGLRRRNSNYKSCWQGYQQLSYYFHGQNPGVKKIYFLDYIDIAILSIDLSLPLTHLCSSHFLYINLDFETLMYIFCYQNNNEYAM